MVPSAGEWQEPLVNAGLNTLNNHKKSTLTLFRDLTVSAQQDVIHRGVKDETHILQKALLVRKYVSLLHILATLAYFRSYIRPFSTDSYSSMHWETVEDKHFHFWPRCHTHFYTQGAI